MKPIERIAKLLALAEGTNNPNEAAVAAAQAQRLMTKHQIARSDIADDSDGIKRDETPLFTGKRIKPWLIALANGISQSNGCMTVVATAETNRVHIVGRVEDITVVRVLFQYLRREIEHHVRIAKAAGFLWGPHVNQFRLGAVVAVSRAMELARKQAADEVSSTAIIKLDDAAEQAEQWAYENIQGLRPNDDRKYKVEVDDANRAFYAGIVIGEQIPIINPKKTIEK